MESRNFKSTVILLGEIHANSKHTLYFYLKEDLDITKLSSSCGCTTPTYQKKKGRILVKYSAGKLPPHLSFQSVTQFVDVTYDGVTERLFIKGIKVAG